jgi:hypothetical protein
MGGRPRTPTAWLDPERLKLLREVFGSSLHAYRVLSPLLSHLFSYAVFRRVWDGKEERPETVESVDQAFRNWASRQLDAILAA